ncbi:MAG: DUF1214 domain-containing protein [Bacteroidales bacterium]|nr:DUF1214 domain-containing protein [Bacteroidales bacterium]
MRQLLFLFLKSITCWQRLMRNLKGKSESDIHAERIVSGKAWDEFCDNLKVAGAALHYQGTPLDAYNQAEGIRYLSRLTRAGLEAFIEYNDPAFPILRRMVHETVKMGADNPDNYYFNAQIDGSKFEYRIKGKRNTVHYFGFFTQNGDYGSTGGMAPCGQLDHHQINYEPDGSFEVILSKKPRGKNWLKMEDATGLLIVRQTFFNRLEEIPAELHIENLNGRKAPDPITPVMVDEGLKKAGLFVGGASLLFSRWTNGFKKHANTLPLFDPATSNAAGGDPNIIYYHSYWKLEPDESLVIEVKPPGCDSWNFQLNNYWMESLDYRFFTVCINKASAVCEPDGTVNVIVAHADPGHPNWLNTCGHTEGTMCWRWYRLQEGENPVEPTCKVIIKDEGRRTKNASL